MAKIADLDNEVRGNMSRYWKRHSIQGTIEEMMLDSNASSLHVAEEREILALLPSYKAKDVIELGAGIGRFTGEIAQKAKSIIAVDFMENFCEKNKEANGSYGNVEVLCADVTKLNLLYNSADIVFSNWLLMYLSNDEVADLAKKMLLWLRKDGYLFFRESCFHPSGNTQRLQNPSKYRDPACYQKIFQSVYSTDRESISIFALKRMSSVQTYIKHKDNPNQVWWLLQKQQINKMDDYHGYKTFQEFLDNEQYSRNSILRYEKIFGKDFISTGGLETTKEFVGMLDMKEGDEVLDVGSGIGGSAFYMAEKFKANVLGIDLSSNMINIAYERANEREDRRVQFELCDATQREFSDGAFDVVYSRDTILHIEDKLGLFKKFLKWLKPGGRLLITDYCCTDDKWSDIYTEYVKQRGYHLMSPKQYGKVVSEAGFIDVSAEDRTWQFIEVLNRELTNTEANRDTFIKDFGEADYQYILDGWHDKLKRCNMGDQKWGLVVARKPL
ncbi:unnamed protein product [Owenia fusiformis]|uniref:phosphoethanolamine N-methyltransferase n=1 Tax=Owenia fusiformis TaxID=6347 RepID=A0A8J1XSU6_OWEFU|nr:unnamed protein product [Owenia fusiformis]